MNNYFNPFYRPIFPYQRPYYHQPDLTIKPEKINEERSCNTSPSNKTPLTNSNPVIDILGIQLHSDDILILLLIFFLYKENIDDKLLFIALFSLLF